MNKLLIVVLVYGDVAKLLPETDPAGAYESEPVITELFKSYEDDQARKLVKEFDQKVNSLKFQNGAGAKSVEIPETDAFVQGGVALPTRENHGGFENDAGGAPKCSDPTERARTRVLSRACLNQFWVRQRSAVEQVLSFLQKSYKVNVAMVTMIGSHQQFHVCELGLGVSAIPRCQSFCAWTVQNKYVQRSKRGAPSIFEG